MALCHCERSEAISVRECDRGVDCFVARKSGLPDLRIIFADLG
jgi:hypothetical protein